MIAQELAGSQSNIDRTRDLMEKQELQRRIEQALQEQLEQQREARVPIDADKAVADSPRFRVTRITVLNDDRTGAGYSHVVQKYLGTLIGREEILSILRDLTNYYAGLGYSTTTVTLSNQSIQDGVLEFRVDWGVIAGWLINGRPPATLRDRLMAGGALPGWKGRVLSIYDVDQAIENLSNAAKGAQIQVVPAEQLAHSYLDLTLRPLRGLTGSLDVDNSGSENADGHYKTNAQVTISDVLGINDSFTVGGGVRLFDESERSAERNAMASLAVPWGRWAATLSYSRFKYRNTIDGAYGAYVAKGGTADVRARLSRVLTRNQTGKTTVWAEFGSQDSDNYVAGARIGVSSRRYSNAGLGISKAGKLWGGAGYADLLWSRGVGWLDSYARYSGRGAFDPLYSRWASNLSWTRGFGAQRRLQYSTRIGLQYSADTLLSANLLNVGDEYTVRGFKGNGISGERGAYLANTLSYTFPLHGGRWVETLTPSIGADIGTTKSDQPGANSQAISGVSIGMRVSGRFMSASALWGMPLRTARGEERESRLYLRASLSF